MNQDQIASFYRQTSARGSSPVGLLVKLYDAILEDFRRSCEALETGHVERRTTALNHALLIIAELESVLDHERGGIVAKRLRGFYNVTRAMIVEANARASRAHIERLIELFLPLKRAWQVAEEDVAQGKVALVGEKKSAQPDSRLDAAHARMQASQPNHPEEEVRAGWNA